MQALKCMIIGDSKVGKTDLFLTFTTGCPAEIYTPTVFDTYAKEVTIHETKYNLGLWDSAGDKVYDEIRPISYPHVSYQVYHRTHIFVPSGGAKATVDPLFITDCFIICYAVNDRDSYENIEKKWKPEILRYGDGPNVPIILAGMKSDLRETNSDSKFELTPTDGEELKYRIGAVTFMECSTKVNKESVHKLMQKAIEAAILKKAEEDKPLNPIWGFEDLKILVCGDSTVGKSSILHSYTSRKPICDVHQPTLEVVPHYQDVVLDGIEFFLGMFDLPSSPVFLHDRIKEYQRANGVILCYAINDPFSFQNVEQQWLPEIKKYCPEIPLLLVGNKIDLKKDSEILIPSGDGEDLMLSIGATAFVECSAKTLENIQDLFIAAVHAFKTTKAEDCDKSKF